MKTIDSQRPRPLTAAPKVTYAYVLQHLREMPDGEESVKMLGVFSTERGGRAAIKLYRKLPGFKKHPDGFYLDQYSMDEMQWTSGFVTLPPPRRLPPGKVNKPKKTKRRGTEPKGAEPKVSGH